LEAPKKSITWSSHYLFILASIGSSVGLSNIWKFTYLAGENGGGAFVLVYLLSLLLMGIPVLAAEFLIGRRGRTGMVNSLSLLSDTDGISKSWTWFGWTGMTTVFLVLTFYCVIAGWTVDYFFTTLFGLGESSSRNQIEAGEASRARFNELLNSPLRMSVGQVIFLGATIWIVAMGIKKGLESSVKWMMPLLFGILIALVVYSAVTADFSAAVRFLFTPDFEKINQEVILKAFGQAFFSLGIGVGVMLTYGAYMPEKSSILPSAMIIAFSDGLASILAGLAIFPIVFGYGLSPAEGPGLIFTTLPVAFISMPAGNVVGSLFFLLLFIAALTSSISLLESIIGHLEFKSGGYRKRITIIAGILLWIIGIPSILSFNLLADWKPFFGKNFFDALDYLSSNLVMPICGILMAVVAGWALNQQANRNEMQPISNGLYNLWLFLIRYFAPFILAMLFITNL